MKRLSLSVADNARYAKLRRQVGKVKFVVKQTLNIAAWHFRPFARLEVVRNEIVRCEKIVQILRRTLFWIGPNAKDIRIATAATRCQPCLAEIGANVRHENIAFAERSHRSCCWFAASLRNTTKIWPHIICRHIILRSDFRYRNSISDQRSNF